MINVLVFPAGEINSIELHNALSTCVNIKLFGASSIDRHGPFIYKNYISNLPFITSSDFVERFNGIIDEYKIDIVFPTHDTVAKYLSEQQAKINAKIMSADVATAAICRDKEATYKYFQEFDFIPKTFSQITELPVFIKPKEGQGGVGAKFIKTANDLSVEDKMRDNIICEYLPGEEYTVDCLTDRHGGLIHISPRSRKRTLAGIAVSGCIEELTDEIRQIADTINKKLKFLGLWWFQIKKDKNDKWKLLEISTRVAGTMCLTRAQGINLPLLSVYIAMGYDIKALPNPYHIQIDRTLISRYKIDYEYDIVYLDFDDTVTLRGSVNLDVIKFVYQCKRDNKKIVLLTRHEFNIYDTLKRLAIAENLFDKIIVLYNNQQKADFINPEKAIFIDNAYKEREEVYVKHKIPVFDVDGIEILLDWRK